MDKDATQYRIQAPAQRKWNPKTGQWEIPEPYSGTVWGVRITDGVGQTEERSIAIEFADMGYAVEPYPKSK
jgi:hypothetical protein